MTVIEQNTMEIICEYLPRIAQALEKIAKQAEKDNNKEPCSAPTSSLSPSRHSRQPKS